MTWIKFEHLHVVSCRLCEVKLDFVQFYVAFLDPEITSTVGTFPYACTISDTYKCRVGILPSAF